jgi:hypothetical protein
MISKQILNILLVYVSVLGGGHLVQGSLVTLFCKHSTEPQYVNHSTEGKHTNGFKTEIS